jgi:hypothetical protein
MATLACWFRTTSLVYLFGISPTILKEAKRVEKMGEKLDGDIAKAQDTLKRAKNMEEKYVTLIQNQMNEGGDPQLA